MMRNSMAKQMMLILPLVLLTAVAASAVEMVSSHARALSSVSNVGGYGIIPIGTQPASYGDLAPVQLFEITKPAGQSVTISRMFTSCTCVQLEADKRTYGPGERAILRLRNIIATPPGGMSYALYVQFGNPAGITLRYDTFVQSSQFVPAPDGTPPTRGNIIADGVVAPSANVDLAGGANIDVIVPKAEIYVPDTSEYTLRKQAERKKQDKTTTTKPDTVKDGVQPLDKNLLKDDGDTPKTTAQGREKRALDRTLLDAGAPARADAPAADSKSVKEQRPSVPSQLQTTIDAAITQAERTLERDGLIHNDSVNQGAVAAPPLASDISTSQVQQYQVEARQIGQGILNPPPQPRQPQPQQQAQAQQQPQLPQQQRQPAVVLTTSPAPASTAAPLRNAEEFINKALADNETQDSLWRVPRPRGAVRTTGSFSSQPPPAPTPSPDATTRALRDAGGQAAQTFRQNAAETLQSQTQAIQQTFDAATTRAAESFDNANVPFRTSNRP